MTKEERALLLACAAEILIQTAAISVESDLGKELLGYVGNSAAECEEKLLPLIRLIAASV